MVRAFLPAALASVLLVVGCGGDSDGTDGESPERAQPQLPAEAQAAVDRLSKTMDRLKRLTAAGECRKFRQLRRQRAIMRRAVRKLEAYEDDPVVSAQVGGIVDTVRDTDVTLAETLAACREQRKLERLSDEADRLADEIEQQTP